MYYNINDGLSPRLAMDHWKPDIRKASIMNRTVTVQNLAPPPESKIVLKIEVTTQVNVSAFVAQQKVTKLLMERIGNLLYGGEPDLVVAASLASPQQRLYWRVPVVLAYPASGPVGTVGTIDVNVQNGEVLSTPTSLTEIAARAKDLARRTTPDAI